MKPKNAADPTKEGYTAQEMVDELNKQFAAKGIDGEVKAYLVRSNSLVRDPYPDGKNPGGTTATTESVGDDNLIFEGIEIRTVKEGPDAIVNIDKDQSTAYDTLFTIKDYNKYGTGTTWDAVVDNETVADYNGYSLGQSAITSSIKFTSANNKFELTLRSTANRNSQFDSYPYATSYDYDQTFTIDIGTGTKNLNQIISAINADFGKHDVVVGKDDAGNDIKVKLSTRIEAVKDGNYIKIVDKEDLTIDNADDKYPNWYTQIDLSSAGANAGYRILFQEKETYEETTMHTKNGSFELTASSGKLTGPVVFYINGVRHTIGSYGDTPTDAKNNYYLETPIRFSTVESRSETKPQNFTVEGNGTTTYTYWAGGSAQGQSKKYQGRTGYEMNTPATLEVGPKISSFPMVVDDSNNKITLGLNGKDYTFTLANSNGSAFDTDGNGKYSQSELEDALQDAIDKAAGTGFGGAVVEIKNGQIVITSRLNSKTDNGADTKIESYAQGQRVNTFFDSLVRSETAASCTSKMALQSNITLTSSNDLFEFSFTDKNGNSQNVSFHLLDPADGGSKSFSRTALRDRINQKLKEVGTPYEGKVQASIDGSNHLVLTTTEAGEKTHIEYTTGPIGATKANATAIFGDIDTGVTSPAAQITLNQNVRSTPYGGTFTGEKTFELEIDGTHRTFYVQNWTSTDSGTNSLVAQLNNGINGHDGLSAYGVTASISGGKLVLTRDVAGNVGGKATSLKMSYASGGTAMEDIFGKTQASRSDDVEITASGNKLTIKAIGSDGKPDSKAVINIFSNESGGTLKGKDAVRYWDHVRKQGFHSAKFSTVTSVDLSDFVKDGGIELTRWNNQLKFEFTKNGTATNPTWTKVDFRLTESAPGTKTSIDDIVKELQSKMDAALGKDVIEVLFDTKTNKLSIKSAKAGAQFQFKGLESKKSDGDTTLDAKNKIGGGFFHHVMCRSEEQTNKLKDPTDINGDQFPGDIFAQGRHDLIFDPASLHPGISDTLTLDLTYVGDTNHDGKLDDAEKAAQKTITLTMKLDTKPEDWLKSSSAEVLKTIRQRLNEAISSQDVQDQAKALGIELHEGLIEVDIGRHDTGIWGNNDKVALSFTITKNPDIATPVEGYFYIDGIRGNAAYETFYYTEGELIPAFITGTKDISNGVVLGKDDNELTFLVDGEKKTIDLSKLEKGRRYSAAEIIQTITDQFEEQGLPLAASITQKGALKISYDRMGKHTIEQVTGSARNELFFEEHYAKRLSNERDIRISSFEGDRLSVYSPRFSTSLLHINSICISRIKYAEKATNRLKEAIHKVAEMRSTFGAIQNRFEHTVNNNLNKHENLQAAESRIRDADISKEMMEFSNLSIIQQAGQSVLAQANQSRNLLLSLLQ